MLVGVGAAQDARKGFLDGTHRLVPPEVTLEYVRPFFPAFGITRIANVTGLDRIGLPVVMVCRPNSRSLATSQGKGTTLAAAMVSGVMESIELFHGEYITLPLKLGSWEEISPVHSLVDVEALPSIKQTRFSPSLQILWVEGNDFVLNESVWVPFEVVHTSAKVPPPSGSGCFLSTSNGLASGNHELEATLHAVCETIERDATALWEAGGPNVWARTRLGLSSIDDVSARSIIDRCERLDFEVAVWETTSDIGIPAFITQITDLQDQSLRGVDSFTGMGCHPSRNIALLRSLTEAIQCRLTLISGSRDDLYRDEYGLRNGGGALSPRYATSHPVEIPLRDFRSIPTWESETFNDDLQWVVGRLRAVDLNQVIVVNLTKPEFQIPVVRAIIPGLEGPDDEPDYVPGRRAQSVLRSRRQ